MNARAFQKTAVIAAAVIVSVTSFFRSPVPALTYTDSPDVTAGTYPSEPSVHKPPAEIPLSKNELAPSIKPSASCPNTSHPTEPYTCSAHAYGAWETIAPPTCKQDGVEIRRCSACGGEESRVVPATGHQYLCIASEEPTVSSPGYKLFRCSACQAEYTKSLPKLSIQDADMCGDSLLEKVLPNAPYPSFTKQAISRWAARLDCDAAMSAEPIPMPKAGSREVLRSWEIAYRYLTVPFAYTTISCADGSTVFNCWVDSDATAKQDAVYARVYEILAELDIDSTVTKQEAAKRINRWICAFKEYDYADAESVSSPYHSLFVSAGKCHNYALAFQLLCLGAGIECHYYTSNTMNHAWNKVYFSDGSYLWVDTTWNDTSGSTKYLLIDTDTLSKTHSF